MSLQTMIDTPLSSLCLVQLSQPEHQVPWFYLSPITTVHTQLDTNTYVNLSTFVLPRSHDYLNQICPQSQKYYTGFTHLCKGFRTTLYFRLEDLLPENLNDPWLEWANATIPAINSIILVRMGCALTGFIFVVVIILFGPGI